MKPEITFMMLTERELFILDHALRERLKRTGALAIELEQENALLDEVNDCIRAVKRIKRENRR